MRIIDLKKYFEETPSPRFFLTDVFSWRGIYAEVAFVPSLQGSREESLQCIETALTYTFEGYKGGEFEYDNYTTAHFEVQRSDCTDMALYRLLLEIE